MNVTFLNLNNSKVFIWNSQKNDVNYSMVKYIHCKYCTSHWEVLLKKNIIYFHYQTIFLLLKVIQGDLRGANTIQHNKPVPKNEKHKKKMRTARMKQLWEWRENNRKNWEGNKKPKKRTGVSFIRKVKREIKYCCAIKINSLCTHIKY